MSGLSSFFNSLSSALSANNISAAATAASALQSALGTSQAVTSQATSFLNNFNLAQANGNQIGMQMAVMGLQAMQTQLPQSVVPLIALLANPSIQADKAQSAVAVANIQTALAHSTSNSVITAAQVKGAISALGDINTSALSAAWRSKFSDLDADAVLAEDALGVVAVFFPQAAAIAALIALLVEVKPFLDLHPPTGDADPERDANAYGGRGGRGN